MSLRTLVVILFLSISADMMAEAGYCFRVYLKDKGICELTAERPENFLSEAAIRRRQQHGIAISSHDMPIASSYIDSLVLLGGKPVVTSKWHSTVVVSSTDSLIVDRLNELSIVDSVKWIWRGTDRPFVLQDRDTTILYPNEKVLSNPYGYAEQQIEMMNGKWLHQAGFRGQGMSVAVIDAGFSNVDRISVFEKLRLCGTHNVVFPGETVFDGDDHGTKVLSCMASYSPGVIVGTAPEASYWLIKSEDSRSEFPIEEDYWTAAVEFADSVGVQVISSSLGYFSFDVEEMNYDISSLDGKTALISRTAQMAADKGILVFSSAGNEGGGMWEKITFPSDAEAVLTVGAITDNKKKSMFSSTGFTADYRVKPDIVALGSGSTVVDHTGNIRYANGTSFSTPIVAGLGVCLWQALPELTNRQIIELIRTSASQYERPDAELGYGIPDIFKAWQEASASRN